MKKVYSYIIGALLLATTFSGVSAASWGFQVSQTPSKINSCAGANVNSVVYVPSSNTSRFIYDEFFSEKPQAISDKSTTIRYWQADTNLVSTCTNQSAWQKYSDYSPGSWQRVVATGANCTFNKPSDKNKRNVQFVFNVGYYDITLGTWTPNPQFVYANLAQSYAGTSTKVNLQNISLVNPKVHSNECLNIELRYCGDGILEPGNGETCDPEDPSKTGWGNGGCNTNTCQPLNNPVCKELTVNPKSGTNPLDVTATCTGYKVNTFKIDCGNGQIFTGNGKNSGDETFSKVCNYKAADTYTPTCFINDTITANSCKKSVDVTNPKPSILVYKTDANVFDLDTVTGNDTQTVYKGSEAVFKIRVTNNGKEGLRDITLADPVETSCATKPGTFVNLTAKNFINTANTQVGLTVGGVGNHTDATLEVGEWFEYSCKKTNTQSNYTNTVTTRGIGITSGQPVSDSDPTVIVVMDKPEPKIKVTKRDANPKDLDGSIGGNDSQTVERGTEAVFHITVENTGAEDLKDIVLVDAMANACATKIGTFVSLASKKFTNKDNKEITIITSGAGNHNDDIFQVNEKFTYVCSKADTQADYTNIVDVSGVGISSGKKVIDNDPTKVIIKDAPAIQVVKEDANSNDLDGEQFNDTQTVVKGEEAVFHIRIKNSGAEDLKNISLIDTKADACASKAGTFVNLSGKKFTNKNDVNVIINFDGAGNHNDDILQVGEEFTYTCAKPNTQENYTNIVEVSGVGVKSGDTVKDDDPTVVIVQSQVYDLALRKTLSSTTPGPFKAGENVTFDIEVFNQGNIDANNIEITDYIPTQLTLSDANWTASGSTATKIISKINAGSSQKISISFKINQNVTGTIKNFAEISQDDGVDCDSFPDNINGNQSGETGETGMIDDDIGTGCDKEGDEDDHDIAIIVIEKKETACTSLTATPITGISTLTSLLSCSGENVTSYKIEVKDIGGNILQTINSSSGSVTLSTIGNYNASCYVNNEATTVPVCQKTLSVTPPGGGGGLMCNDIIANGSGKYTCYGSPETKSIVLECGVDAITGKALYVGPKSGSDLKTEVGGGYSAQFDCTATTTPRCYVRDAVLPNFTMSELWKTREACTIQSNPKCGDGVVQPEKGEQCDFGGTPPYDNWGSCRKPGTPGECTLPGGGSSSGGGSTTSSGGGTNPGIVCTNPNGCVITTPNGGEIVFGPKGDVIIGHLANPLEKYGEYPFIRNNSDYDLSFDALCVKRLAGDSSLSAGEYCMDIGNKMIYPGETISLQKDARWKLAYPVFTANKGGIPAGANYGSGVLSTSVKKGTIDYFNAYFAAKLNVRVAKPAVTTVGGGASYVKDTTTGDIKKITDGVAGYENNKNFVGNSVSNSGVSSYSDSASGASATGSVSGDKTKYEGSVNSVTNTSPTAPIGTAVFSDFKSYNGLANVFIISGKNVVLESLPAVSKATTYIVEGGNLTLTKDIISNQNLAFVVKGGNIIIKDSVKHIDGTYITIPVSNVGGNIKSTADTNVQLVVNGSLYGDITQLVESRYYIDAGNASSRMLSVGTIVSFGSGIFHKPAPLVSQFIGEYLGTTKVAQ